MAISRNSKQWNHSQSVTERGYGHHWRKIRSQVLARDMHLCQECKRQGRVKEGNQVDHIKAKAKEGTDDMDNLQTLCVPCHKDKTIRDNGGRSRAVGSDSNGYPLIKP